MSDPTPPGDAPPPDPVQEPEHTPPPARTAPDAPTARAGMLPYVTLLVVPVLCLGALWLVYSRLSGDIAELRESQRQLTSEIAALRRTPMIDISNAPVRGSEDAVVTLIEYSDYECPFCIKYFIETLPRLDAEYVQTGRLRYVFRDFPVDELHPAAIKAHEASRCAGEQGRFWEMHGRLFSPPGTHGTDALEAHARDVGVDMSRFSECLGSGRTVDDIRRVANEAVGLGASGTPSFFLGLHDPATGQVRVIRGITGAQPYEVFQQTIETLLAQAGR
jgi:protein-disulfide isomerase